MHTLGYLEIPFRKSHRLTPVLAGVFLLVTFILASLGYGFKTIYLGFLACGLLFLVVGIHNFLRGYVIIRENELSVFSFPFLPSFKVFLVNSDIKIESRKIVITNNDRTESILASAMSPNDWARLVEALTPFLSRGKKEGNV